MSTWFRNRRILGLSAAFALISIFPSLTASPQQVTVTPKLAYAPICTSTTGSCSTAPAGFVTIAANSQSVVVSTSAVTTNSQIFVQLDTSLGGVFGFMCNSAANIYRVSARSSGSSFTITSSTTVMTNPACLSYFIVN